MNDWEQILEIFPALVHFKFCTQKNVNFKEIRDLFFLKRELVHFDIDTDDLLTFRILNYNLNYNN